MPNWVTNKITMDGSPSDIAELKSTFGDKFSFDKIIPMPKCLGTINDIPFRFPWMIAEYIKTKVKDYVPSVNAARYFKRNYICLSAVNPDDVHFNDIKKVEQGFHNVEETGYAEWYTWRRDKWNTKWDACDCSLLEDEPTTLSYGFDTAWSFPEPVYETLSMQYPNVTFVVKWQDEDEAEYNEEDRQIGQFHCRVYSNGKVLSETMDDF